MFSPLSICFWAEWGVTEALGAYVNHLARLTFLRFQEWNRMAIAFSTHTGRRIDNMMTTACTSLSNAVGVGMMRLFI